MVDVELRQGWVLRCHPAAAGFARAQHIQDPDQAAELDCFISWCTPGMVFFDAGAHSGVFSLAALHYGGPTARAVAIDPSPEACRLLRLHASVNDVEDRLQVVPAAVAAADGLQHLVDAGVRGAHFQVLL